MVVIASPRVVSERQRVGLLVGGGGARIERPRLEIETWLGLKTSRLIYLQDSIPLTVRRSKLIRPIWVTSYTH